MDALGYEESSLESVLEGAGQMIMVATGGVMLTLTLLGAMKKCRFDWIPESLVAIAVGFLIGEVFDLVVWTEVWANEFDLHEFQMDVNAPLLNVLFLPIIIFESGWSLRSMDFWAQLPHILIFGVVGSGIAMILVAGLIVATSGIHGIDHWRTAGAYASLIAATDPVATLVTYSSLRAEPLLNILVYGEATINDAVAITVFTLLNSDHMFSSPCDDFVQLAPSAVWKLLSGIATILLGSMLFGMLLACVYTLIVRFCGIKHSELMVVLFITMSCYFTFAVAQHLALSGIIAVLFCSVMMGFYTKEHLSPEGHALASFSLKQLSLVADMGIFMLIGVDIILFDNDLNWWGLCGLIMLFCLFARAIATFLLGCLANIIKKMKAKDEDSPADHQTLLSWKHLLMMWHAGLRGGIALMLTLQLGEWVDLQHGQGTRQRLLNCTIAIVCVFLLVFGGTTQAMLNLLGIQTGVDADPMLLWDRTSDSRRGCFHFVHERALRPLLVGSTAPDGVAVISVQGGLSVQSESQRTVTSSQTW